jgi:hypothetical protein
VEGLAGPPVLPPQQDFVVHDAKLDLRRLRANEDAVTFHKTDLAWLVL